MSYFSPSRGKPDKSVNGTGSEVELDETRATGPSPPDMVSTLGRSILVTGNIVCDGSVQIFGRVIGDIQAPHLVIGEGAQVEGNVTAQETVVQGVFKGIIRSSSVKLQGMAMVEGEIFNKSLTIEESAQFEGVSRRIDRTLDQPSSAQAKGEMPAAASTAQVVPISGAVG